MIYISLLKLIKMRNVFFAFFFFAIPVAVICQKNNIDNYEIVQKSPWGYLPTNSKNLPILVTTKESKRNLATLKNSVAYRNATKKQKNLMIAQSGAKFAYLDSNNNFVVPFGIYDYADVFGLGRKAIVANKGKYGIIDEYGELVLPLEYDFIEQPSNSNYANIFLATKQNEVTVFDEYLNVIPTKGIVSYWVYDGNIYVVNKENKIGLIDFDGKLTIPFLYDTLYQEHSVGRIPGFIAKKDGFYGFVSNKNEIIQPFKYKFIYAINDGIVVYVDLNNKVGIFTMTAK
jgi:hypothetical protein